MYPTLKKYIEQLIPHVEQIPAGRKEILSNIAEYIRVKRAASKPAKLMFICTHNSRRSHMAQVWAAAVASFFELEEIETYSAGTEVTAFNSRAIAALQRSGFIIEGKEGENTEYEVRFGDKHNPLVCFSKVISHPANPSSDFAAIMTCSDADENCPFVPGTDFRVSLPYYDPKQSDGTGREQEVYDERCRQIGTEMLYLMQTVRGTQKVNQ